MISPEEVSQKAVKIWDGHRVERAYLSGESLFPMTIPAGAPGPGGLEREFAGVRDWIARLRSASKEARGKGYSVRFTDLNLRRLGWQSVPDQLVIETRDDFLFLASKEREFARFEELAERILAFRPVLRTLLLRKPGFILEYENDWEGILAVCGYFLEHPLPGLYLRQLDLPGIDTKFIEARRGILAEILEELLPENAKQPAESGRHFLERRFGLRREEPMVRFRLLDASLGLGGLTDLTVPLPEFRGLRLSLKRVFIVENKMNGLCFPECAGTAVIFGMGYGADLLGGVPWLHGVELRYWGDIDTHGFAILDSLRFHFPGLKSFLMDGDTLMKHRELWGEEGPSERFLKALTRLSPEEGALFEALRNDAWGRAVRLEQERIGFGYFHSALAAALI